MEVEPLLAQLGEVADDLVLAGGQGQAFWVDQYAPAVPELKADVEAHGPLTSKDIDFVPHQWAAVQRCADRLRGEVQRASLDHATPNPVIVHFRDRRGYPRDIDFLDGLYGIRKPEEVYAWSLEVAFLDPDLARTGRRFRVIHPVLSMEARLSNVVGLPKYRGEHGLRQARASIVCAREYVTRRLDTAPAHQVLKLNERIFDFRMSKTGRAAADRYGLEAFEAVCRDPRLPEDFHTIRYPQMQRELERTRQRDLDHRRRSPARDDRER